LTTKAEAALAAALLPPLRFASKDEFARLERLKGFETMATRALDDARLLDGAFVDGVRALVAGFDSASAGDRRRRAEELLALLGPFMSTQTQPPQAATTRPPVGSAASRQASKGGPTPRSDTSPTIESTFPETRTAPVAATAISPTTETRAREVRALRQPEQDAKRALDWLAMPISALPGIGPKRAALFLTRDIPNVGALLMLLPRTYEDRRQVRAMDQVKTGMNTIVRGRVVTADRVGAKRGARFHVVLDDGTGRLTLVFFRYRDAEMKKRFTEGALVTAVGEVQRFQGTAQIIHPLVVDGDAADSLFGIWPVYPEMRGLHPAEIGRAVRSALQLLNKNPPRDLLSDDLRERADVPSLHRALVEIHAPPDDIDEHGLALLTARKTPWHLRLAFEEIFVFELALAMRKDKGVREPALAIPALPVDALARELLPFTLTNAQVRTTGEVLRDMAEPHPMGRLLQGDVGAGKTAVAALAALATVRAGQQACILAPTEILAEQHASTFARLFSPLGIRVELFTGGQRGKARGLKIARLQNREIMIAIGTHALLTDDVRFAKLGLAVIDEQHRFGVGQRMAIRAKGARIDDETTAKPHLLVMTATPIPRSLALTLYGDLSVSVLDELPPGRSPIDTHVLREAQLERVMQDVAAALARDERVYIVYPLIEESEKLDLKDATNGFEDVSARFGADKTALIHGRMSTEERERAMQRFSRGEVSILVSTTVIEVGVDVPSATLMIVRHAERFGLSQLHQLRGRVGRSDKKSRCLLVVGEDGAGKDAIKRLSIMEESTDGFRIAEEDLAIRGPGDFLGTRQSGLPAFAFADLTAHAALIARAKTIAEEVIADDPLLASEGHRELRTLVFERFSERLSFTESG
jgi:ATP-dependent DNA helicase RecG